MTFLTRRFAPFLVALTCFIFAFPIVFAQDSYQTATVVSVRQIRHMSSLNPSRYSGPIYFTVDFAFRISAESHCVGYETPVLDEVRDLLDSNGKNVKVRMRGKKLVVLLPTGRRIKAELVKPTQC
jgi:hypothetical protein